VLVASFKSSSVSIYTSLHLALLRVPCMLVQSLAVVRVVAMPEFWDFENDGRVVANITTRSSISCSNTVFTIFPSSTFSDTTRTKTCSPSRCFLGICRHRLYVSLGDTATNSADLYQRALGGQPLTFPSLWRPCCPFRQRHWSRSLNLSTQRI
jgi:hypothetical protein